MIDNEIKQKNGCFKFDSDDSLEYYLQTSQYINIGWFVNNYSIEAC